MTKDPFFAYMSDSLHNVLVRLSSNDLQEMPVLADENNKVLGIITIPDLVKLYDNEVDKIMKLGHRSILSNDISDNAINNNKEHVQRIKPQINDELAKGKGIQ